MNTMVSAPVRMRWHRAAGPLLLVGAMAISISAYWQGFTAGDRLLLRQLLPLLWLSFAWLAGLNDSLRPYRAVLLGFFAVSAGIWLASLVGHLPSQLLNLQADSLPGLVAGKLSEAVPIVAAILL